MSVPPPSYHAPLLSTTPLLPTAVIAGVGGAEAGDIEDASLPVEVGGFPWTFRRALAPQNANAPPGFKNDGDGVPFAGLLGVLEGLFGRLDKGGGGGVVGGVARGDKAGRGVGVAEGGMGGGVVGMGGMMVPELVVDKLSAAPLTPRWEESRERGEEWDKGVVDFQYTSAQGAHVVRR